MDPRGFSSCSCVSGAACQQAGGAWCVLHGSGGKARAYFPLAKIVTEKIVTDSYRKGKSGNLKIPPGSLPIYWKKGKIIKQANIRL